MPAAKKQVKPQRPSASTKLSVAFSRKAAAHGITPLEYMLRVMRETKNTLALRLDAAKAAAPYVHPKLAQVDHTVGNAGGKPFVIQSSANDDKML